MMSQKTRNLTFLMKKWHKISSLKRKNLWLKKKMHKRSKNYKCHIQFMIKEISKSYRNC